MPRNVPGERRERSHDGRTLKASICDLIDNSIDGGAHNIRIQYDQTIWRDDESGVLLIEDDGLGIAPVNMMKSLQFNSEREEEYNWWELGSFGVGLDHACLAHGSEITLFSKQQNGVFRVARLSGESTDRIVDNWAQHDHDTMMDNLPSAWNTHPYQYALERIQTIEHGTIVLLENMDSPNVDVEQGLEPFDEIENFIGMIFHEYLEGIDLGPRNSTEPLIIYFNSDDEPIEPLDPFWSSEIGEGTLDGLLGTYMQPHTFLAGDMEFIINRYIIPPRNQRSSRIPGADNRLTSALRAEIHACQGIYFKRNSRILDGPWNGENWRRTHGMGMGTSQHTVARWEFILPPEAISNHNLVTPDKTTVKCDAFFGEILKANREKLEWHPQDVMPYGTGEKNCSGGKQFNHRAKVHGYSWDIPNFCNQNQCETRILYNLEFCDVHHSFRCQNCNSEVDIADSLCQTCQTLICQSDGCDGLIQNDGDNSCLSCQQPECSVDGCQEQSIIPTDYCEAHESQVCNEPFCREISSESFNRCDEHLVIFEDEGWNIRLVRSGSESHPIHIDDGNGNITLNLDRDEISALAENLSREFTGG
jgi:hypothetical protein